MMILGIMSAYFECNDLRLLDKIGYRDISHGQLEHVRKNFAVSSLYRESSQLKFICESSPYTRMFDASSPDVVGVPAIDVLDRGAYPLRNSHHVRDLMRQLASSFHDVVGLAKLSAGNGRNRFRHSEIQPRYRIMAKRQLTVVNSTAETM